MILYNIHVYPVRGQASWFQKKNIDSSSLPSLLLQVHPLLLTERAETCTVWLLRYTLHVTSAPSRPAHKGKEDETGSSGCRRRRQTDRQTGALRHRQTGGPTGGQMMDADFDSCGGKKRKRSGGDCLYVFRVSAAGLECLLHHIMSHY